MSNPASAFANTLGKLDKLIADLEIRVGAPHRPSPFEGCKISKKDSKAQDSPAIKDQKPKAAGTESKKVEKKDEPKSKKEEQKADKKAETIPTKKGEEPKGKGEEKPGEAQIPSEGLLEDFARLDIRVGNIVECWKHPDSDKLYCEKIDIGGGEIREIGSGLQKFVDLSEMKGLVLVLANLKPRKLGGKLPPSFLY